MELLRPATWSEALEARAARPDALPLCGGTDVMVDLNFGRARPAAVLDLTRIPELARHDRDGEALRLGAGVTYARAIDALAHDLPGLAAAARTVGSPQIRNRGTVGGNLGSASPAGDALPPLYAGDATVELASVRGARTLPVADFVTGPRRTRLAPDELIAAVRVPRAPGPQVYAKVGTRNAMVVAVCSLAVHLDPRTRTVAACLGSAAPTPRRASGAERYAAEHLDWSAHARPEPEVLRRFGSLVADAAQPIDDQRGTAAYRRHALAVLARRCLTWAWDACG